MHNSDLGPLTRNPEEVMVVLIVDGTLPRNNGQNIFKSRVMLNLPQS